ncbi:hypothetical protein NO1_1229 [Candidatus Termititenax aidoneus]|uniref:Uncharacterized protein n=1 Tax=Termititenax aidoneus TaxID=2218524 RepID=A0A388TB67_TERA1|nr:hypothetical protein NO1_1229 [Candidatus Termititenax aidoneus]
MRGSNATALPKLLEIKSQNLKQKNQCGVWESMLAITKEQIKKIHVAIRDLAAERRMSPEFAKDYFKRKFWNNSDISIADLSVDQASFFIEQLESQRGVLCQ